MIDVRLTFLLMSALVSIGCGERTAAKERSSASVDPIAAPERVAVHAVPVALEELATTVVATGTIAAKQTSNIGPLVEGVIERIHVRVGDRVRKGDPLFETRPATYQRRVAEAKAAVSLAHANVQQAERNLARASRLEEQGMLPRASRDDADTALQVALAERDRAQAILDTARQDLVDTLVRAPFDGAITARMVDQGVYMANRFSGMGNSSVVQVQELGIVAAIVRAPEANLPLLEVGLPAKLYVEGRSSALDAQVLVVNDLVDPATRTVELRIPVANPDYSIKPGQFVRAEVVSKTRPVLVLPARATLGTGRQRRVFVIEADRLSSREVSVDVIDQFRVRIVNGVEAGQRVAVSTRVLSDGDRVVVESLPEKSHVAG